MANDHNSRELYVRGYLSFVGCSPAFTLVELLVVIAVMAVLSAIMLTALDPVRKSKQARDASRKSSLAQIAGGISDYYTLKSVYTQSLSDLIPDELKTVPKNPTGAEFFYIASGENLPNCSTQEKNCTKAVLYDIYESPKTPCVSGTSYWAWTSSSGRLGKVCRLGVPSSDDIPVDDL